MFALRTFFSDHPQAADREARIRALTRSLPKGRPRDLGGFEAMQTAVRRVSVESPGGRASPLRQLLQSGRTRSRPGRRAARRP